MTPSGQLPRVGRRRATAKSEIERVALTMFTERGFEDTTIADIASAVGIARRTFFGYFESKNDVVWGDFDGLLQAMEAWLAGAEDLEPVTALRSAVMRFNRFDESVREVHRMRMALIVGVPALQAHATLRYADWRGVVARFFARRLGLAPDDLVPRLTGHLALGAAMTAYEHWLDHEGADLESLLGRAVDIAFGDPPPCLLKAQSP